jgi:CBS domain-containing protein
MSPTSMGCSPGEIRLPELRRGARRAPLVDLDAEIPTIPPVRTSQTSIGMMTDHEVLSTPVVDALGRMLGVVTLDDVVERSLPSGRRHWRTVM